MNIEFILYIPSVIKNIKSYIQNNILSGKFDNSYIIIARGQISSRTARMRKNYKVRKIKFFFLNTENLNNNKYYNLLMDLYNNFGLYSGIIEYHFKNITNTRKYNNPKISNNMFLMPHLFYDLTYINKKINTIQNYDVLFIGRYEGNRSIIANKLISEGLRVLIIKNGHFENSKMNIQLQTKVIVDTHYYDYLKITAVHRCVPALYCGCFVVTTMHNDINKFTNEINPFYKFVNWFQIMMNV